MLDNKVGRPRLTPEQKQQKLKEMASKVEPFLKSGLSLKKSLIEARISRSDFYRMLDEDKDFRDTIEHHKQFVAVLCNNALVRELLDITDRQTGNQAKGIKKQKLTRDDKSFLMWMALNSNLMKDEYGERKTIDVIDPEAEIEKVRRMIDETGSEEIIHPD